jgi:hypothetical protein
MKTMMNQLLESLRKRVTDNLATIRANEKEIRNLLAEPLSNQRSYNLSNRQSLSKKILSENAENLKIQNMIVAFLNNYKDIPEYTQLLDSINNFEKGLATNNESENEKKVNESVQNHKNKGSQPITEKENNHTTSKIEQPKSTEVIAEKVVESLFELTASGKLAYNRAHPKYRDQKFFNRLLDYHTQREEYEICAKLMKTRD